MQLQKIFFYENENIAGNCLFCTRVNSEIFRSENMREKLIKNNSEFGERESFASLALSFFHIEVFYSNSHFITFHLNSCFVHIYSILLCLSQQVLLMKY